MTNAQALGLFVAVVITFLASIAIIAFIDLRKPTFDCSTQTPEHLKTIEKLMKDCDTPLCVAHISRIGCKEKRYDE